jgi:hypothetical protein
VRKGASNAGEGAFEAARWLSVYGECNDWANWPADANSRGKLGGNDSMEVSAADANFFKEFGKS